MRVSARPLESRGVADDDDRVEHLPGAVDDVEQFVLEAAYTSSACRVSWPLTKFSRCQIPGRRGALSGGDDRQVDPVDVRGQPVAGLQGYEPRQVDFFNVRRIAERFQCPCLRPSMTPAEMGSERPDGPATVRRRWLQGAAGPGWVLTSGSADPRVRDAASSAANNPLAGGTVGAMLPDPGRAASSSRAAALLGCLGDVQCSRPSGRQSARIRPRGTPQRCARCSRIQPHRSIAETLCNMSRCRTRPQR